MSVFKTTFSRALEVFPSDNANIPFPNTIVAGVNTSIATDKLIDNTVDFIALNIKEGDIVYNNSTGTGATVLRVNDASTLFLNADIFISSGEDYIVYQASSQTGIGNQGCYLYVGTSVDNAGYVKVTTIGGDIVTFNGILAGTVLPVQVIKLHFSGTVDVSNVRALW